MGYHVLMYCTYIFGHLMELNSRHGGEAEAFCFLDL